MQEEAEKEQREAAPKENANFVMVVDKVGRDPVLEARSTPQTVEELGQRVLEDYFESATEDDDAEEAEICIQKALAPPTHMQKFWKLRA